MSLVLDVLSCKCVWELFSWGVLFGSSVYGGEMGRVGVLELVLSLKLWVWMRFLKGIC